MNHEATIAQAIASLRDSGVDKVIAVDSSSDGTPQILQQLCDTVLFDDKKGLGFARNLGASVVEDGYILFIGADNLLTKPALQAMTDALASGTYDLVTACTRIQGQGYINHCMNLHRAAKLKPGPADVVGTPQMMHITTFRRLGFDGAMRYADDTDMCDRASSMGLKIGRVEPYLYEFSTAQLSYLIERWKNYGRSDIEYYRHHTDWSLPRKIQSLLHPLVTDFIRPLRAMRWPDALYSLPFVFILTAARYRGWFVRRRQPQAQ